MKVKVPKHIRPVSHSPSLGLSDLLNVDDIESSVTNESSIASDVDMSSDRTYSITVHLWK